MIRHYLETWTPGTFVSDSSVRQIESRDMLPRLDPHVYAYRFYDREELEHEGETLVGKPKNHSPTTYIGDEFDLDTVKLVFPSERILISNMELNGYRRVVKVGGRFFPVANGDIITSREVAA